MTLCTAPDVRFNLHECIDNRVGYLRSFSLTVVFCAIGCLLVCWDIKRAREEEEEEREKKENRTDKRKKERTKYFEYYSTLSDKYIYIYIFYM